MKSSLILFHPGIIFFLKGHFLLVYDKFQGFNVIRFHGKHFCFAFLFAAALCLFFFGYIGVQSHINAAENCQNTNC